MTASTPTPDTWHFAFRVILKATLLFIVLNLLFAWVQPMDALGHLTLYNGIIPGRFRLPYGENPAQSYSLSLSSLSAMLTSHIAARPHQPDEFRVFIIGDSAAWGWRLMNADTLAGRLNALNLRSPDGRRLNIYNLGYPVMSLTKDLLILDAAMVFQPDAIIWPLTLESFPRARQLTPVLLRQNAERVRSLISHHDLHLNLADPGFIEPDFAGQTLIGQRRQLADWLRLQLYGFAWAATGIDQHIPPEYTPRQSDFDEDLSWGDYAGPVALSADDLAFDVLAAGVRMAGSDRILIVNEPMFISDGRNSDLRYNAFYPRWAYDSYRQMLMQEAAARGWQYLDLWDAIAPGEFTDSPVHLNPAGSGQLAARIGPALLAMFDGR